LATRPARSWYQSRAVAESVKTLAWRYAVGGEPFSLDRSSSRSADEELIQRYRDIVDEYSDAGLIPVASATDEITMSMRHLRGATLDVRKAVYGSLRIADQRAWYATKAAGNQRSALRWSVALLTLQVVGITASVLKVAGILELDVLGVIAAIAVAVGAWLQLKQHDNLAQSYSVAAHQLSTITALININQTEGSWARFVYKAELAISREHTSWRARVGVRQ